MERGLGRVGRTAPLRLVREEGPEYGEDDGDEEERIDDVIDPA